MAEDYIWGAEALEGLRNKGLDKHFEEHKDRYLDHARSAYERLNVAYPSSELLQPGDLYVVLRELISFDGELDKALRGSAVAETRKRRWVSWFTWYVALKFWEKEVSNATVEGTG